MKIKMLPCCKDVILKMPVKYWMSDGATQKDAERSRQKEVMEMQLNWFGEIVGSVECVESNHDPCDICIVIEKHVRERHPELYAVAMLEASKKEAMLFTGG